MNQELMTLDFWQDTVIYEGKAFPIGTLACDALNVPADTIAKMNEHCEKINLLLGLLNAGQDASALFPMAREAALTMLSILSKTPPFSYMNISQHRERIEKVFTTDNALKYVEFAIKAATNSLQFEEVPKYSDAIMLQRYTAVFGHLVSPCSGSATPAWSAYYNGSWCRSRHSRTDDSGCSLLHS